MLATNHGLTGMLLGATLPAQIAFPLALASHFILDSLPHYSIKKNNRDNSRSYKAITSVDTIIALSFAVFTASTGRWSMFFAGWIAYGPDLYWVFLYFKHNRSFNFRAKNRIAKFHETIQKEYSWGLLIEVPVALLLSATLFAKL